MTSGDTRGERVVGRDQISCLLGTQGLWSIENQAITTNVTHVQPSLCEAWDLQINIYNI